MAKAKAGVSKRQILAKRGPRRPYEYGHEYGLRVEAPPRPVKAAKARRPAKKR